MQRAGAGAESSKARNLQVQQPLHCDVVPASAACRRTRSTFLLAAGIGLIWALYAGSFPSFLFVACFWSISDGRGCGDTRGMCTQRATEHGKRHKWRGRHKVDGGFVESRPLSHFRLAAPDGRETREKEVGGASISDSGCDSLFCLGFPCYYFRTLTDVSEALTSVWHG
ncbi:hypothetical protein LZ30DRAFT_207645 [Colletotrichum cereale]|nr:hypothetical protein LZ30DRAFT_207645 [Colletotrichum cereale]